MKKLAIGVDDFKKFREHDAYVVVRSLFIEDILEEPKEVLLFPLPRHSNRSKTETMKPRCANRGAPTL